MSQRTAIVGVSDHAGWAVLMTVASAKVVDRRRVEILDPALPKLPHHHEAQGMPMPQALALIERVRVSANACSRAVLEALASDVPATITGIALRRCPVLPESVAERITNYQAQCNADSVMYREALAGAATALGWDVHWYDPREVFADAARALKKKSIDSLLAEAGESLGRPWQKDHRLAMAAAIASGGGSRLS